MRNRRRPAPGGLRPWALVEIAGASDDQQRTALIRAAYRLSGAGVVALALRGVTRQIVDRVLDPIVDASRDHKRGVVYLDADDAREELWSTASSASVVITCTEGFRVELARHGIDAQDGARLLELHEDERPDARG